MLRNLIHFTFLEDLKDYGVHSKQEEEEEEEA